MKESGHFEGKGKSQDEEKKKGLLVKGQEGIGGCASVVVLSDSTRNLRSWVKREVTAKGGEPYSLGRKEGKEEEAKQH